MVSRYNAPPISAWLPLKIFLDIEDPLTKFLRCSAPPQFYPIFWLNLELVINNIEFSAFIIPFDPLLPNIENVEIEI